MQMLLVRHAQTDHLGTRLSGRAPGVRLNAAGLDQARALADRLRAVDPAAIYSSPLERALETAAPVARACGRKVTIEPDLVEIDFGAWTGAAFDALDRDPLWQLFNAHPGRARIPGGERLADVAARSAAALRRLARRHEGQAVIVVSHLDVLRLGLARLMGRPLDTFRTLAIAPASIFSVQFSAGQLALDIGTPSTARAGRRAS